MNLPQSELNHEYSYLDEVLNIINKQLLELNITLNDRYEYINQYKSYLWENRADMDYVEVSSNMQGVNNEVVSSNNFLQKKKQLLKSINSPYFGRMDFVRVNESKRTIYIGICSIEDDYIYYVYDWRAPISSMFYDFGVGTAEYKIPKGIIKGKITLRRQYKIINGKLLRCFNSDLNIIDDYLQEVLDKDTSQKLRNIVTTIQKEQNQIIRNVQDRIMIVQGVAGSGKTTVALHQIAYILYKNRNIRSKNILIFSPNKIFAEYISDVLPDLGEENALQTTFSDLANSQLNCRVESFSDFISKYQSHFNKVEYELVEFKLSDNFKRLIDKYVSDLENNISFTRNIVVGKKEFTNSEITGMFRFKFRRYKIIKRIDFLAEYLCDLAFIRGSRNIKDVAKRLKENLNCSIDLFDLYREIVNSQQFYENIKNNSNLNKAKRIVKSKILDYEDGLGMLYLKSKVSDIINDKTIKHVVVDEAQDYTPIQFELLKVIFSEASFTILGDKYQTINPFYHYSSLEVIGKTFNSQHLYLELNKTYRSTEHIVKYTNNILGLNNVIAMRLNKSQPIISKEVPIESLSRVLLSDITELKNSGVNNLAIITKSFVQAEIVYNHISELKDVLLISESSEKYSNNVNVIPAYLAKGLEFDAVIIYTDKEDIFGELNKHLFYVACTRALHKLILYNQATI